MHFFGSRTCKPITRLGTVLVTAALVLASYGVSHGSPAAASSGDSTIATSSIPPTSVCGNDGDYVQQSLNGDFTGCFRVPALYSSSLVVALTAYWSGTSNTSTSPTTTVVPPVPNGQITLSLGSKTATPGEAITVMGRLSQPAAQRTTFATLCWDGCENGLQEQGAQIHWTSFTSFHASLKVPDTAWLVRRDGTVSVHPLLSGDYQVGIECLLSISGCALRPADAQTTIRLKAPRPTKCLSGQRCEIMTLSSSKAKVGDKIVLKGWAPLQDIIGQPFGYSLSITTRSGKETLPNLSYSRNQTSNGGNVVLTPRTLRVMPSKTWADLGRVHYSSSTWSGPSPIDSTSYSNLIAWCQPSGLVITGGSAKVNVPAAGVSAALRGSILRLFSSPPANPQCATVLLDPRYRDSIYAGFNTAQGGSAPPVYMAGLYTTNAGASWRTVPTPAGTSMEDFGGFSTDGDRVVALFAAPNSYESQRFPSGTNHGFVHVEVTTNGGASWTPSTLGCPRSAPCATLGPYQLGNCNMNESSQPLLLGPADTTAGAGVKWTSSSWITTVNSCVSPQLVVTSPRDLLLLDPSSQYPLLQSTTSGRTWSYVVLPLIPGTNYSPDSAPQSNSLLMAPDGSLFTALTTPSGQHQELFRLKPSATSWCRVPGVFGSTTTAGTVGPLRANGPDLIWNQTIYPNGARPTSSMHVVPLSSLSC
jgi:hypothetical protein